MADVLKACIATSKAPTKRTEAAFLEEIRGHAQDQQLRISAILGMEGRGCYNLGLKVEGDPRKAETFVNALTLALGPCSKWSYCNDEFEGFVFQDLRD